MDMFRHRRFVRCEMPAPSIIVTAQERVMCSATFMLDRRSIIRGGRDPSKEELNKNMDAAASLHRTITAIKMATNIQPDYRH